MEHLLKGQKSEALLRHMLLCLDRMVEYTADAQAEFFFDAKTQDAVVRNLEITGQAVRDAGIERLAQNDASNSHASPTLDRMSRCRWGRVTSAPIHRFF